MRDLDHNARRLLAFADDAEERLRHLERRAELRGEFGVIGPDATTLAAARRVAEDARRKADRARAEAATKERAA